MWGVKDRLDKINREKIRLIKNLTKRFTSEKN